MVNLTIDGVKVEVPENTTILEAAKSTGINIPALCYDPNLEIVSSCRLCVVEVEGNPKLQTSCSIPVSEGMVVNSESKRVQSARKELLRLLLDNHPNDCLVCDKAGECLLQEYAYRYDVKFREHDGDRREAIVDTSSPYIFRDESKCILCGKCVRTCAQVSERAVLSFANRGFNTKISADANMTMEESSCVSCSRCVTVCPTGALLDVRNMGEGRVWQNEKETIKCNVCQYGCDFNLIKKGEEVVGVEAKSPENGRPLCLKGRLWTEINNVDNPKEAYLKKDGVFEEVDWEEALGIRDIAKKIENLEANKK